ncbi:MAG: hypothetical protein GY838_13065 [bacterium]|nr:hypothetical protein [bacterium]
MLFAYLKDPNPTFVAKECNVSWQTAKKYIQEGAPLLGVGPFASEARRILRTGDKLVRLTEVTKQVRVQVEEKDIGAMQDMLFEFEGLVHDGLRLARARMTREQAYFVKLEEAAANKMPADMQDKIKKPRAFNVYDIKNLAFALQQLDAMKRQFWDRLEIIRRTEVETTARVEEGVHPAIAPPPVDIESWEPHEIAAYVDSIEAGDDPVYPSWMDSPASVPPPKPGNGAEATPEPPATSEASEEPDVSFPPGSFEPT